MTTPSNADDPSNINHSAQFGTQSFHPLRYWPAIVLAALIWIVRQIPSAFPDSGFIGFMMMAMGPLVLGVLILLWWAFFSRAMLTEKLVGVFGLLIIGFLTHYYSDPSMQGFGLMLFAIPRAFTAFALAAALLSGASPLVRTGLPLLAAAVSFAAILPLRTDGIWGDMRAETSWRWQPTKTDQIVETLRQRPDDAGGDLSQDDWRPDGPIAWGEFRGPNRDGKATGVVLDADWTKHPPRELWRRPVGPGWGSFCVVGDRLFTQEQRGEEEMVVAYRADDGAQIWTHSDQAHFNEVVGGSGPRGTPTYHQGRLYTMGATGSVDCLDASTGNLVWTRNLTDDTGAKPPQWGFSSSPLVVGDLVLVHAGGTGLSDVDPESKLAKKGLIAYDKTSGDVKWTAPSGDHGYSSPQLLPPTIPGGKPAAVLLISNSGLAAHDPETGEILWSNLWKFDMYRVVQPIVLKGGGFLIGTTMGGGTRRIAVSETDGGFRVKEEWTTTAMKPYFNDYVEHKGYLYGFDHDIFACVDLANGKRMWKKGRYGNGQVLLLPDADQLLIQAESGEVLLLAANPKEHRELAKFAALNGKTWNHPVVVGNRLYVRNGDEAACFELTVTHAPPSAEPRKDAPAEESSGGE